jgi:hypothetical protein
LQGELRKIKPPTFDGDHKKGEYVEAWLFDMRKYFQLHNYSSNLEAKIKIYHLQGKTSMWWDQLKHISKISWRQFKKYFQKKYLAEHYYDKKMQEFFELKLGNMTMDEY